MRTPRHADGGRSAHRQARSRPEGFGRLPAIAVVALLLGGVIAAGTALDRRTPGSDEETIAGPADLAPVAPAAGALGSTWYCAAGSGAGGGADHQVVVANVGDRPVDAVVTAVPGALQGQASTAEPVRRSVQLPARGRQAVRLGDLVESPFLSAIVEAGPGEIVVEHTVTGEDDSDGGPCASSSSPTWHLAGGVTTRDALEHLVLFNPFPDDAVVDITFATPDGLRSPPAFSGFIVPGRRVIAVDVGAVVSRHPNVSASVVARSGRLVVERLQRFDGSDGPGGLAVTLGAPAPAEVWQFPDGLVGEGSTEVVTVYNPSDRQAEVDVEVLLAQSADPALPQVAEPFVLSIPPLQSAQVAVHDDDRVPDAVGHALTVRSQNGVPVVAERWIRSGDPADREGVAATLGSPLAATRWLSTVGSTAPGGSTLLTVTNPSPDSIARLSVVALVEGERQPLDGLTGTEVPPSGRVVLDIGQYLEAGALTLVLDASQSVVVERDVHATEGGLLLSVLVPAAGIGVLAVDAATFVPVPGTEPPPTTAATSTTTSSTSSTTTTTTTTTTAPPTTVAPPPPPP